MSIASIELSVVEHLDAGAEDVRNNTPDLTDRYAQLLAIRGELLDAVHQLGYDTDEAVSAARLLEVRDSVAYEVGRIHALLELVGPGGTIEPE